MPSSLRSTALSLSGQFKLQSPSFIRISGDGAFGFSGSNGDLPPLPAPLQFRRSSVARQCKTVSNLRRVEESGGLSGNQHQNGLEWKSCKPNLVALPPLDNGSTSTSTVGHQSAPLSSPPVLGPKPILQNDTTTEGVVNKEQVAAPTADDEAPPGCVPPHPRKLSMASELLLLALDEPRIDEMEYRRHSYHTATAAVSYSGKYTLGIITDDGSVTHVSSEMATREQTESTRQKMPHPGGSVSSHEDASSSKTRDGSKIVMDKCRSSCSDTENSDSSSSSRSSAGIIAESASGGINQNSVFKNDEIVIKIRST